MRASEKVRSIKLRTCKLTPTVSVPFLLIVGKKISNKRNLRKEGLIVAHSSKMESTVEGKVPM